MTMDMATRGAWIRLRGEYHRSGTLKYDEDDPEGAFQFTRTRTGTTVKAGTPDELREQMKLVFQRNM